MATEQGITETMTEEIGSEEIGSIAEPANDLMGATGITTQELTQQAVDIYEASRDVLSFSVLVQLSAIVMCLVLGYFLSIKPRAKLRAKVSDEADEDDLKIGEQLLRMVRRILFPTISALIMLLVTIVTQHYVSWETNLLSIGISLSVAWAVASFMSSFIQTRVIAKWIAGFIWFIAALHILGWWDGGIKFLDGLSFAVGESRISVLGILKGGVFFAIFLWVAIILSRAGEKQIKSIGNLTPSLQVLFGKVLKITLIFIALLFGLNAIGVDLTSFAIFSGAVGVGLGFGLQKVVSNFISGIILLLDRSIKPGDVIAVTGPDGGTTFGWVNTLGARYVSIIRRDGKEHLIPNELLITERVENWSFSNNDIRIHIGVGVSYNSDVRKALDLCLEAAEEEPRVKKFPEPVVRVLGFGASSVDLEIRGWINDPVNGIANVKGDILLSVWDKFHEHGIEIPYPQQDLHVKSIDPEVVEFLKAELKKA